MTKQSKSKVIGVSKDGEGKPPLDTQSSKGVSPLNTSATLGSSQEAQSLIGFQPTKPLDLDKETANAKLVVTFAAELGALVVWKRLELEDGQEVIALCFPSNKWTTNAKGELVVKR